MNLTLDNIQLIGGTRHIVEEIGIHKYVSPPIPEHKEIAYHDMLPQDQYFRRIAIPDHLEKRKEEIYNKVIGARRIENYKVREKLELQAEIKQALFSDPMLNAFMTKETEKRNNGFWFYNGYFNKQANRWESVPTYITGYHYMLLQWYREGDTQFNYRENQRAIHYAWELALSNPRCYGIVVAGSRRFGKTAISSNIALYDLMKYSYIKIGIQSTNDELASKLFNKIVLGWKNYPYFFKPLYTSSATPVNEINYTLGKMSGIDLDDQFGIKRTNDLEHGSVLDYRASGVAAYDSEKLHRYVMDEWGKTEECDVNDRWGVVKPTLEVNGVVRGKAFCTSTVEDMLNGDTLENARTFWNNSELKWYERNDGSKEYISSTGLIRVFVPAYVSMYCDRYGRPDIKRAMAEIELKRIAARANGSAKQLAMVMRQFPIEESDMFVDEGGRNRFNLDILNNRKEELLAMPEMPYKSYSLEWNEDKTEVIPVEQPPIIDANGIIHDNPNAIYRFAWLPDKETWNAVERVPSQNGIKYKPKNTYVYSCVTDPIKNDTPSDTAKASKACILVAPRINMTNQETDERWQAKVPFVMYHGRRDRTSDYWEDAIKLVHFLGCQILIEQNAEAGMGQYIESRGYGRFLAEKPYTTTYDFTMAKQRKLKNPNGVSKGFHSTNATKEIYYPLMEVAIEETGHLIPFIEAIEQLIKFDIRKTQHTDIAVTYGFLQMDLNSRLSLSRIKNSSKLQERKPAARTGSTYVC